MGFTEGFVKFLQLFYIYIYIYIYRKEKLKSRFYFTYTYIRTAVYDIFQGRACSAGRAGSSGRVASLADLDLRAGH